jgi:acetyltransferase-like isoleucine patch superfamily enzyme
LDAKGGLYIGDNVSIAHNCSLISFNHTYSDPNTQIKYNVLVDGEIRIESDVWIGCGVRILAGVTINKRSIVAAGAVVNKTIPSHTISAGIPAIPIKNII